MEWLLHTLHETQETTFKIKWKPRRSIHCWTIIRRPPHFVSYSRVTILPKATRTVTAHVILWWAVWFLSWLPAISRIYTSLCTHASVFCWLKYWTNLSNQPSTCHYKSCRSYHCWQTIVCLSHQTHPFSQNEQLIRDRFDQVTSNAAPLRITVRKRTPYT